jgi:hypothetical protein
MKLTFKLLEDLDSSLNVRKPTSICIYFCSLSEREKIFNVILKLTLVEQVYGKRQALENV